MTLGNVLRQLPRRSLAEKPSAPACERSAFLAIYRIFKTMTFEPEEIATMSAAYQETSGTTPFRHSTSRQKARWSDVQNQYQRRVDLIPNLVATVQGYAKRRAPPTSTVTFEICRWTRLMADETDAEAAVLRAIKRKLPLRVRREVPPRLKV
jgi:hypothetical protein